MNEGWYGRDHLILFNEDEIASAWDRYAVSQFLPAYKLIGLRGGMISFCKTLMGPRIAFQPCQQLQSNSWNTHCHSQAQRSDSVLDLHDAMATHR